MNDRPGTVPGSTGSRLTSLLPAMLFGGIGALWAWRTLSLLSVEGEPLHWAMRDFRDGIYYPVVAWLDGVNPYSPTQFLEAFPQVEQLFPLVSPGVLLLNLPFAALSFESAMVAFFLVSLLLLLAYAVLLPRVTDVRVGPVGILWLAVFLVAGRPAYAALTLGQGIIPVAIGVTLALRYSASNPVAGGIGLSLGLLKPTFGVPLALLLLARRDYRTVCIGIALAGAAAMIPLVTIVVNVGIGGFVAGIGETLARWGSHPAVGLSGTDVGRFDAAAALVRLGRLPIADVNSVPVAVAILGVAVYALRVLHGRETGPTARRGGADLEPLSSLVILLAVLLSVYHQRYDALVLAGPIVALARGPGAHLSRRACGVLLVLLVAVWFNYLTTYSGVRALGLTPWEWPWRIVASLNSLALLVAFGVAIYSALSRERAAPYRPPRGGPQEGGGSRRCPT